MGRSEAVPWFVVCRQTHDGDSLLKVENIHYESREAAEQAAPRLCSSSDDWSIVESDTRVQAAIIAQRLRRNR